jgi:hypothetical protein
MAQINYLASDFNTQLLWGYEVEQLQEIIDRWKNDFPNHTVIAMEFLHCDSQCRVAPYVMAIIHYKPGTPAPENDHGSPFAGKVLASQL